MASREELLQGLRAADAAGDTAAASAFARALQAQQAPVAQPQAPQTPQRSPVDMVRGAIDTIGNTRDNIVKGGIAGLVDIGRSVATAPNMIPGVRAPWTDRMDEAGRISKEMRREAGGAGMIGSGIVDVAGTAGLGGPILKGVQKILSAGSKFIAPAAAGAEGTAAGVYLSPDDRAGGGAAGGVGGVAGQQILSRTLGRLAKPVQSRQPNTHVFENEGVPLTAGQSASSDDWGGKLVRFVEDGLSVIPGFGAPVQGQREAAKQAWRDVPLKDIAQRGKVAEPQRAAGVSTRDMQESVGTDMGQRYDSLLANKTLRGTQVLENNIDAIVNDPKLFMTDADRAGIRKLIEAHLFDKLNPGGVRSPLEASMLFKAQSELATRGRDFSESILHSERDKGQALQRTANEVYNFIQRRFPKIGKELQDLRGPYRELSTLRAASKDRGSGPAGDFTPKILAHQAEKRGDEGLRLWGELAEPIIGSEKPGTLSNYMKMATVLGTGGVASVLSTGGVSIPAAAALLALFGTRTGQKGLQGQLGAQKALSDLLTMHPELVNQATGVAGREAGLAVQHNK